MRKILKKNENPIVKNIEALIKNKDKLAKEEFKIVKILSSFFLVVIVFKLTGILKNWVNTKEELLKYGIDSTSEYIPLALLLLSLALFALEHLINILTPKSDEKINFEDWFPNKERRRLIVRTFAILSLQAALTLILFSDFPKKYFKVTNVNSFIFIELALFFFFITYTFILFNVYFNPKLILSKLLVSIGTSCWAIWIAGSISICFYISHKNINYFIISTSLIFLLNMTSIYATKRDTVQWMIIKIVKPEVLLNVFKTNSQKAKDIIEALKIIYKLQSKEKYGVQQELLRQLSAEFSPKNTYIKTVFYTILIFIISSLGEGIVQDLWKEKVSNFFCNTLGILCKAEPNLDAK